MTCAASFANLAPTGALGAITLIAAPATISIFRISICALRTARVNEGWEERVKEIDAAIKAEVLDSQKARQTASWPAIPFITLSSALTHLACFTFQFGLNLYQKRMQRKEGKASPSSKLRLTIIMLALLIASFSLGATMSHLAQLDAPTEKSEFKRVSPPQNIENWEQRFDVIFNNKSEIDDRNHNLSERIIQKEKTNRNLEIPTANYRDNTIETSLYNLKNRILRLIEKRYDLNLSGHYSFIAIILIGLSYLLILILTRGFSCKGRKSLMLRFLFTERITETEDKMKDPYFSQRKYSLLI